jgi:hypothetical protein
MNACQMVPWTPRERQRPHLKRSNDDLYVRNEMGAEHLDRTEWHAPLSAWLWPSQKTTYALDHRSCQRGTPLDGRYAEPCDQKGCRHDYGRWGDAEKRRRGAQDDTFEVLSWMAKAYIAGEGEFHSKPV